MKSTAQPISPATEKSNPANRDRTAQGAPGLVALVNPKPRLPGSKAEPGTSPFVCRVRDLKLGSPVRKLVLLTIATFCPVYTDGEAGECWPSNRTLCGAAEICMRTLKANMQGLVDDGWLGRRGRGRGRRLAVNLNPRMVQLLHHSEIANGATAALSEPANGATAAPQKMYVREEQQQQQSGELFDENPPAGRRSEPGPTPAQMRGITDMARELREDAPAPETRAEASDVFRELKRRVSARRTKTNRDAYAARQERHRQYHDYAGRLREMRQQDNAGGDA